MSIDTTDRLADHQTLSTRALLTCGVIAGPLFPLVALLQAATRDGFDLRRHPFSMLSLGDLGWLQIVNFVVVGTLFIACSVGVRRVIRDGPGSRWAPRLVAAFGASQVVGGVFLVDAAAGFPAGAPELPSFTWTGIVHSISGPVGFGCLSALCFVIARRFAARGERGSARASRAVGVVMILGFVGVAVGDLRVLAASIVLGWAWAALIAARLRAEVADAP